MAISVTDLIHWGCMDSVVRLSEIMSVCDLGQQELELPGGAESCGEILRRFAACCGLPEVDLGDCGTSAEMWVRLGRRIVSLDIVGDGADLLRFDLNCDHLPPDLSGTFDLVTNCGTSEHVLNQYNVFKVMHELTRPGGVMYHSVPVGGYTTHGLVTYTPKMFGKLAHANGYQWIDMMLGMDREPSPFDPNFAVFMRDFAAFEGIRSNNYPWNADEQSGRFQATDGCIRILYKREGERPFEPPLDLPT
jgi:SAM-dependent methyltransferase